MSRYFYGKKFIHNIKRTYSEHQKILIQVTFSRIYSEHQNILIQLAAQVIRSPQPTSKLFTIFFAAYGRLAVDAECATFFTVTHVMLCDESIGNTKRSNFLSGLATR